MRSVCAIFVLLSCVIEIRAAELPVIKCSEAARYVGKQVRVRDLVISVRSSPLGTAFINFGRDYPNQTFAGFIAAGSKMADDPLLTTLQGKIIEITGTIVLDKGKPEIKLVSADQIRILAPRPAQ